MNDLLEDLKFIFDHTYLLFNELKNKNIFITGGTGFFGTWFLESFVYANKQLNLNSHAFVLTRDACAYLKKHPHFATYSSINFIEGDVKDFIFPEYDFSYLIHAATDASAKLNMQSPLTMFETITLGTKRVLEFSKEKKIQKTLVLSSGGVYGKQPLDLEYIPETFPARFDLPNNPSAYGLGKTVSEFLSATYAKKFDLSIKIARCFAFVGPHLPLDIHFAIGNFIRDAINKKQIVVNGDGTPLRSYMYVADLIIWLWHILFRGESIYPYNVGSDDPISIASLANLIAKQVTPNLPVAILNKSNSKQLPERYIPSIQRAQNELGLKVQIDLLTSIQKTIRWYSAKIKSTEGIQ